MENKPRGLYETLITEALAARLRELDRRLHVHSDDLRPADAADRIALRGDLAGLHSIRVNDQWRVVFRWTSEGPEAVDVVDYHR
jgi:plasmid maintenance system killer protein